MSAYGLRSSDWSSDVCSSDLVPLLHEALVSDPVVIDVPAGVTVTDPIILRHVGPADGAASAVHLVVRAGADSEVRVIEVFDGGGKGLLVPGTDISVGSAARVGYVSVPTLDPAAWSIGHLAIAVESQGTARTEARRVGKECGSKCRSRGSPN